MNTKHQITFRPRARLLSLLGEQLISDQAVGLIELVKNAYDADATLVEIEILGLSSLEATRILICDNGIGMNREDVEQKWLSPAIDHKERQKKANKRSSLGRLPIGEKGVGRFAVHQLGRQFTMISRPAGKPEVVLEVNWDDFDSGEVFLEDVPVILYEREPEVFTGNQTGTILQVGRARTNWAEAHVKKIYRALRRLQSPHDEAKDFRVVLRCPDYPSYERVDSSDILDHAHYIFRGLIDEQGYLDYEYRCQHPALDERVENVDGYNLIQSASKEMASFQGNECGPFYLTFYVWDRTQEYLSQSGVARDDLDAMAGVSLFRDGLRVLPYGEPGNDWLDLDHERINDPSKRIGNQQIIGFIEVVQENTPDLRDKTNREGLIDNVAFRYLRALIRAAVVVFTSQWLKDRPKPDQRPRAPRTALQQARSLATAVAETARDDVVVHISPAPSESAKEQPLLDEGSSVAGTQKSVGQQPSLAAEEPSPYITQRQAMNELVDHIQKAATYQAQTESDVEQQTQIMMHLASTGMAAERVAHEFGRQVHAALEALGQIRYLIRGNGEVAKAISTLDACLGTLRNEFRVLAPYEAGWRLQRTGSIGIADAISLAITLNKHLIDAGNIKVITDGKDFEVSARSASLVQVFDNLLHNACIWLSTWNGERKITISLVPELHTVIVADTGPGIPSHIRSDIFDAFVTMRSGGRGLGLYITRELLKIMKARISLDQARPDCTGAMFIVQFPPGRD